MLKEEVLEEYEEKSFLRRSVFVNFCKNAALKTELMKPCYIFASSQDYVGYMVFVIVSNIFINLTVMNLHLLSKGIRSYSCSALWLSVQETVPIRIFDALYWMGSSLDFVDIEA